MKLRNYISGKDTQSSFEDPYYLHKTTFFKLNSQNNYDVVFIGDSITDNADWYDIFPNLTIANRSIGSDTIAGILNRMDTIINTKMEKAFIMIGINDIDRRIDIDVIFNNIKPFIQSTLLTNLIRVDNKIVNDLNTRLMKLCIKKTSHL